MTMSIRQMPAVRRCTRCLYDEHTPRITFDERGVCNYCAMYDRLDAEHPTGEEGQRRLEAIASRSGPPARD